MARIPLLNSLPAGSTEAEGGYFMTDAEAWNAKAQREEQVRQERAERDARDHAGDRGTLGKAMRARPEPNYLPSDMPGYAAVAYSDAHLIDRMWHRGQMTDMQHHAAQRVYGLFRQAGLEPRTCSPPGERRDPTVEVEDHTAEAHAVWVRFLRRRELAGQKADLLVSLCLERHPGVRWLATLHAALDTVAQLKGLDPQAKP